MWLMLQADKPDDFVVATGEAHSVREFCERAFAYAGLSWEKYVRTDARYLRPAEVNHLRGDASKAVRVLGWRPTVQFDQLVAIMVGADVALLDDQLSGRTARQQRPGLS